MIGKKNETEERQEEERQEEEKPRSTPMSGAEQNAEDRQRRPELPASEDRRAELADRLDEANHTANQTIDQGNDCETQGKLAIPYVEVQQRGSTKWTDEETGKVHKELNDAERNAVLAEEEKPEYLKLHEAVLEGGDPIEETLKFQGRKPEEQFAEGKLADAEKHPRTGAVRTNNG